MDSNITFLELVLKKMKENKDNPTYFYDINKKQNSIIQYKIGPNFKKQFNILPNIFNLAINKVFNYLVNLKAPLFRLEDENKILGLKFNEIINKNNGWTSEYIYLSEDNFLDINNDQRKISIKISQFNSQPGGWKFEVFGCRSENLKRRQTISAINL
jgi:hypothetical protein